MLAWAIENRIRLSCDYGGRPREICPIILGRGRGGEEAVLAYQVGGETSGGRVGGAEWKCFRVSGLDRMEAMKGEWLTGASHSQRQTCVDDVDYDVNEASPYSPRRSLGGLRGEPG
jgi:hypothetical protein